MFRWSEEKTLKFVFNYIQHDCLWNLKSPDYKNRQMKQAAYADLENTMNLPGFGVKEIKLKIKNIRSTYSQELKKIKESKNSGAGIDTIYIPTVKWFSLLDACLRSANSTFTESESYLASISSHPDDTDTKHETHTEKNTAKVNTIREHKFRPSIKKKKISQISNMVNQLKEITEASNYKVEENEFEVFGKHVGLQLKTLPLILALEAEEHIQLYLSKIRRQYLQSASEQNRITRTPQSTNEPESPCTTDSQYNNDSMYYNDTSNNFDFDYRSSGIIVNIESQRNAKITTNDMTETTMQKTNVHN